MEMFTPDYPKTHAKFLAMKENGFISEKTRAIFLEFTIYNFNLGLYGVLRITFELAPAGDWIKPLTLMCSCRGTCNHLVWAQQRIGFFSFWKPA